MKRFLLPVLVMLCSASQLFSQSKTFRLEVEQQVVGDTLYIDFFAQKIAGNDFAFGASNFAVFVSTQYLDVANAAKVPVNDGPWDFAHAPQYYWDLGFGKGADWVGVSIAHRSDAPQPTPQLLTAVRVRVGRVAIPILDHAGFNTSTWRHIPAAFQQWAPTGVFMNVKANAELVEPAPNFPLCNVPAVPTIHNGTALQVCEGQQVTLNSSHPGENIWYLNGTLIPAQSTSLVATTPGAYTVAAKSFGCISAASNPATVQVIAAPLKPVIVETISELSTANVVGATLQWYKDGVPIAGANSPAFIPTEHGTYTVKVTNGCGSNTSDPVVWESLVVGAQEALSSAGFSVYPNPYQGETNFTYSLTSAANVQLNVYDLTGRIVARFVNGEQAAGQHRYSFSATRLGLAVGTYMVSFTLNGVSASTKIVEFR